MSNQLDHGMQMTAAGKATLEEEVEHLRNVRRAELSEWVRDAREGAHGDLADAAELAEAQREQALLDARINQLERALEDAEVVGPPVDNGVATLGSTVTFRDEDGVDALALVGSLEAAARSGRVSVESPVGQALLGRRAGEVVDVETPSGLRRLEILKVE